MHPISAGRRATGLPTVVQVEEEMSPDERADMAASAARLRQLEQELQE